MGMFALAGLAASAPVVQYGVPANLNQEKVISNIMVSLQPAIDAAIEQALGGASFQTFSSKETVGPVQFSGSDGNSNYFGSFGSSQSSTTSTFESKGNGDNSIKATYHETGVPHLHTGTGSKGNAQYGVVGATFHETGVPHQHTGTGSKGNAQYGVVSATFHETGVPHQHSTGTKGTKQTVTVQTGKSTDNQVKQQQLIQAVMSSLAPSVGAAVQAALANMQNSSQSSFSTTSQSSDAAQFSGFQSSDAAELSGFQSSVSNTANQVSSQGVQVSGAEQHSKLVAQIIESITPSISQSVAAALAAQTQVTQVQTVNADSAFNSQANQASFESNSQSNQQASGVSGSELSQAVMAAL